MNEEAQEPVYTFIEYTVLEGDTVELWNLESGVRAEISLGLVPFVDPLLVNTGASDPLSKGMSICRLFCH